MTPATDHDSFPLPRFEERLWEELARVHPGTEPAGRAGAPRRRRARSARSGLGARRYLVAVAGLAAASAVVVALVVDDGSPDTEAGEVARADGPGDQPSEPSEPPQLPEPVAAPDAVVVEEMQLADGWTSTSWIDEATGAHRMLQRDAAGNPGFEQSLTVVESPDGTATATEVDVDHQTGEYQELPPRAFAVLTRADDKLRDRVESGQLVADGAEVVGGRELLRYVSPPADQAGQDCAGPGDVEARAGCQEAQAPAGRFAGVEGSTLVLVDPATFRPVSETRGGSAGDFTTTYTYLERASENLALLELVIPDGYRLVEEFSRGLG